MHILYTVRVGMIDFFDVEVVTIVGIYTFISKKLE